MKQFGYNIDHFDWISIAKPGIDEPACFKMDNFGFGGINGDIAVFYFNDQEVFDKIKIPIDYVSDPFYYSYDDFTLRVYLELTYQLKKGGEYVTGENDI